MQTGLLDRLVEQQGLTCLSDLRYADRKLLSRQIFCMQADMYSVWEWSDAAEYLTGKKVTAGTQEEAKACLLKALPQIR